MTFRTPTPSIISSTDHTSAQALEREMIHSLDLDQWLSATPTGLDYEQLQQEVAAAISTENKTTAYLRQYIFPRLQKPVSELPCSGLDYLSPNLLDTARQGFLFNGAVEAAKGMLSNVETLPLSVAHVGVRLVSYQGEKGAYSHRFYRRNLSISGKEPMEEVLKLLEVRHRLSEGDEHQQLSGLARQGLLAFAERAVLIEKGSAPWRMGTGSPVPIEMLSGYWASAVGLVNASLELLRKMIDHQRFLFVADPAPHLIWTSLGNALRPGEYLVLDTIRKELSDALRRVNLPMRSRIEHFVQRYADQVVFGLFRASAFAPPYMFYAHRDQVPLAALIAIADGQSNGNQGFPLLLEIARSHCQSAFCDRDFYACMQEAFSGAGEPFRYFKSPSKQSSIK